MIRNQIRRYFSKIVTDLSNDFLITLSMSHQSLKADSQTSLIKSLYDNGILVNLELQSTLNKLDRSYFLPADQISKLKKTDIYANLPINIGYNQNMTDIFTHSYSLQLLYPIINASLNKNKRIKIADFGTGSGYIALAFYHIVTNVLTSQKSSENHHIDIIGYDIYDDFIQRNKNVLKKFTNQYENIKIDFITKNLETQITDEKDFDIIYVGFAITPEQLNLYSNLLINGGTILAPISDINTGEQDLSLIVKQDSKLVSKKIMKCMFSDMLHEKNKDDYRYFGTEESIDSLEIPEKNNMSPSEFDKEITSSERILENLKNELKVHEEELKKILKEIKGHKVNIPPLSELNKLPNFGNLLNLINFKKRKIRSMENMDKNALKA